MGTLLGLGACRSSGEPFSEEASRVLRSPDQLELLTLHPYPHESPPLDPEEDFHGYRVLGRARLVGAQVQQDLLELIREGVRRSDGTAAACFNPRHGVRAVRGDEAVELVICYECLTLRVHGPGGAREGHTTSSAVEAGVERIFRGVGLRSHGRD